VKFAARCDLTIEPETYRRMMEHSGEIAKCAQARVSEEFYRLLRAGAAKRSMELLLETRLLDVLLPELANTLRTDDETPEAKKRNARFWAYLAALDRSTLRRETPPSNALVLATLLFPPIRDALHPDTNAVRDVGQLVWQSSQPIVERLKSSRRDAELARQILLAMRVILPSSNPNRRRPRLAGREWVDDALRLGEIISDADAAEPELAGQALLAEGEPPGAPAGEELPPELQAPDPSERHGRYRHGRRGREERGPRLEGDRPPRQESERAPRLDGDRPPREAPPSHARPAPGGRTPIPDLSRLPARTTARPVFLGTGSFGRWGASGD
jgi:poly(A) polymerase